MTTSYWVRVTDEFGTTDSDTATISMVERTVTFQTDGTSGATLTGTVSQTVIHGSDCTAVTANNPTGWHFVNWTGTGGFTSTDNPVVVSNVTEDMTITANYAINTYLISGVVTEQGVPLRGWR
ncbi:MAG: hypothetical protein MZV49_12975 [Rhodopseudomonas palustris]|nr:hypothetical protein [Rhodopseudomonas palustris]